MYSTLNSDKFQDLLNQWQSTPGPEGANEWPTGHFDDLKQAGGWQWNIAAQFGGKGISSSEMLQIYRELASASLLTTFILTQRNAACQRIELAADSEFKSKLMCQLCSGEIFATVGISHLTTSRQHLQTPPVSVTPTPNGDGYMLNGQIPWATAATKADVMVTGGTLADQRQVLAVVPGSRTGVTVETPVTMLALNASQTGAVHLKDVFVSHEEVLHGPVENVMSQSAGGGAGSLGTSALAIGAAQGTLRQFAEDAVRRPELNEFLQPLQAEAASLSQELLQAAEGHHEGGGQAAEILRRRANSLVTRAAQVWLAATKGAGFISGHPAERAVRESMFFMVWSCPQPVLAANLRELACANK